MSQSAQEQPQQSPNIPPPQGEKDQAEKYLRKLIGLIEKKRLFPSHTDLKKFDVNSMQDHYSLDLGDYEVEISHTKQPDSGQDFYIMLFNNIRKVQSGSVSCTDKLILAYVHLTAEQYKRFKQVADDVLEQKRREEEAKRFNEVMTPVENVLEDLVLKSEQEVKPEEFTPDPKSSMQEEGSTVELSNQIQAGANDIPISPTPQENFSSIPSLTS